MKKYLIIIPIFFVSLTVVSCRTNDEIESNNPTTELTAKNKINIQNLTEADSIVVQFNQSLEDEKKDPPVKDRQDWRTAP